MQTLRHQRLTELRRHRDRARTRLIEIEMEIASLVSSALPDLAGEIAEAEERGDWREAARLRTSRRSAGSAA